MYYAISHVISFSIRRSPSKCCFDKQSQSNFISIENAFYLLVVSGPPETSPPLHCTPNWFEEFNRAALALHFLLPILHSVGFHWALAGWDMDYGVSKRNLNLQVFNYKMLNSNPDSYILRSQRIEQKSCLWEFSCYSAADWDLGYTCHAWQSAIYSRNSRNLAGLFYPNLLWRISVHIPTLTHKHRDTALLLAESDYLSRFASNLISHPN